jgi:tetratricopeptide (TPR) repeat protein
LYRARGQAYETLGEFEQAQHDYTQALDAARKMNNRAAEWQSAIDLGFLWAGRDYAQAETWFRQALILSQSLDDPALHARSLNRIGNWHLNVEQPHEAKSYHRKALAIFQQLNDARGIAETLDLLGMTSYLGGDLIGGTAYYQQAIALFDELGNREGLTSSLATLTMRASTYHTDALIAVTSLAEVLPDAERAVKVAREIGQRSAVSYALLQLGLCLGSQGEYTHALAACQQSLHIAEEIEHRQWQTAAHAMLGGVYDGLLAHRQASDHFEQALVLAQETHSLFWTGMATGYLASVSILLHDYARTEALLHTALSPDTAIQTMAQRMLCCASVELALAQGHPTHALEIIDQLVASAAQGAEGQSSLRVLKLRGEAPVMLQRPVEAEIAFEAAREIATTQGVRPMQWRICIALGNLYQAQGRNTEAEQAFATARTLVEELAATVTDESLRDNFLRRATAMLPHSRPLSPKQAAKQAFGGLTAREREIAALIAHGKFNREIADVLVLSERTIETHVSNIMLKLNLTSRRQIASWAIERGLIANM